MGPRAPRLAPCTWTMRRVISSFPPSPVASTTGHHHRRKDDRPHRYLHRGHRDDHRRSGRERQPDQRRLRAGEPGRGDNVQADRDQPLGRHRRLGRGPSTRRDRLRGRAGDVHRNGGRFAERHPARRRQRQLHLHGARVRRLGRRGGRKDRRRGGGDDHTTSGGTTAVAIPDTAPGTTQLTYTMVLRNGATTPGTVSFRWW